MKKQKTKVIVLTGGSSGIGLATVKLFASKGHVVYELSRSGKSFDGVKHIFCDVTNEDTVKAAIEQVISEQGHIDVLINNAGFGISGPIEFTKTEDAKKQFDVNFFGALNVVKAVVPHMRKEQRGRIIFVSSVAAIFSIPFQSFYSAAKAAMNSLTLALANELRPFHISVCALMPGDVSTGFTAAREKSIEGSDVYTRLDKSVKTMEHDETHGMSPDKMAKKLCKITSKSRVKPLYVGGGKYKLFCFLAKIFPTRFFNWVVGKLY
ncbi:MAG: SDR family oxidoreductase [Bacilli bacterium]|nr:SDR family oxidoreductase [Bacilli bacterium]MDY6362831.1 SDR family oxidoreductase [Bacilli bacterium]